MSKIRPTGESSSLDLTEAMRRGIAEIRREKQIVKAREGVKLLLDVSGSMAELVDGKRKIDHLREAVSKFPDMARVSFSDRVWENEVPEPQANTNMAAGFRHLQLSGPRAVILISDGLPDDPVAALGEAKRLAVPVNILYIGATGGAGEAFMKQLARETGGREVTIEVSTPDFSLQLEGGIGELLALPRARES